MSEITKQTKLDPYVQRRVRLAYIEVIGKIWMPANTCGQRIQLTDYDLNNIGSFTCDNVERWLCLHSGDFQSIIDFHAVCGQLEIPWQLEENEFTYHDCMYTD
jgi:hypothetical protein